MRDLGHQFTSPLGRRPRLSKRRTGRQLDMDLGLRVVVRRDEPGGQQRDQQDRSDEERGRGQHRDQAMLEAPRREVHVGAHQPAVRRRLAGGLEDVGRHHRREHARDQQRRKHGKRRSPAELLEELAGHAAHEGRGQEHGDQREGGCDHRQADLVGRLHGRFKRRLAHAQVPHDVFDLHNGIVHQHAHHQ